MLVLRQEMMKILFMMKILYSCSCVNLHKINLHLTSNHIMYMDYCTFIHAIYTFYFKLFISN